MKVAALSAAPPLPCPCALNTSCDAVYRGVAYDLTEFIDKHPAGSWLINLSLGRDCTALFESYHLRPDVAVARMKRLPTIPDFPVAAVPEAPRPNDSDLYNTIRERVRTEVFKGQVRFPAMFVGMN